MDLQELKNQARQVRRDIIIMTNKAGAGHPGGSLSCTDALVALYFEIMNVSPENEKDPNRDRFVHLHRGRDGNRCKAYGKSLPRLHNDR